MVHGSNDSLQPRDKMEDIPAICPEMGVDTAPRLAAVRFPLYNSILCVDFDLSRLDAKLMPGIKREGIGVVGAKSFVKNISLKTGKSLADGILEGRAGAGPSARLNDPDIHFVRSVYIRSVKVQKKPDVIFLYGFTDDRFIP